MKYLDKKTLENYIAQLNRGSLVFLLVHIADEFPIVRQGLIKLINKIEGDK